MTSIDESVARSRHRCRSVVGDGEGDARVRSITIAVTIKTTISGRLMVNTLARCSTQREGGSEAWHVSRAEIPDADFRKAMIAIALTTRFSQSLPESALSRLREKNAPVTKIAVSWAEGTLRQRWGKPR